MFKPEDISQIKARGSVLYAVEQQIKNFENGFPFLKLVDTVGIDHGLIRMSDSEIQNHILFFDQKVSEGLDLLSFIPASGAASRMFQSLFSAIDKFKSGNDPSAYETNDDVLAVINQLSCFAFYDDLKESISKGNQTIDTISVKELLEYLLLEKGLNYGNLPKGLLKFHTYPDGNRTALEEHFVDGALYSQNSEKLVHLHFTVSPEHQILFEKLVAKIKTKYEQLFGVHYQIGFSQQKESTDTLAVTTDNKPFRNDDGSLLFRAAGHGALLENLNELDTDLIFIKNIDNVVPDSFKKPTVDYKKALAGILLKIQEQIFYYQKTFNENFPNSLESAFYAEAANFLENVLNTTPPVNQYYSEKEELHHYFRQKFNRPIRVCGMVKNQGEPGGGPFFGQNRDGSVSLQIVESSQINIVDPEQATIAQNASYFNPVDLVCAVRNYMGEKYDLSAYSDPQTGFISKKSKEGKTLKAQELPGLWNGSMSDWNTLFVEVPIETFNPVKKITDLLRKEHQAK